MNQRAPEQLDKILALADSAHDGEAAAAVRKARLLLRRDGLSFGDLARAATRGTRTPGMLSILWPGNRDGLETELTALRAELQELRMQLRTQELQLDFWRRRACDLELTQTQARNDAERWKQVARETAERLWDTGPRGEHAETGA